MAKAIKKTALPDEAIINKIYLIREQKVILDKDLAEMYGIETKRLKEAVRRNAERFPKDFMFTLTHKEFQHLRSQFATSSWGGIRYLPTAFTEQGRCHAFGCFKQPGCCAGTYTNYQDYYQNERNAFNQ